MKHPSFLPYVILWTVALLVLTALLYHHDQNSLNRQAYYECLRVTERIAEADDRTGVRVVSVPTCRLP
jgi:hypothetical protein